MRSGTSQTMGNLLANGESLGESSGGLSRRTKRPNGCAVRMKDLVDKWEKEHGPIIPRHAYNENNDDSSDDNDADSTADDIDSTTNDPDSTAKTKGRGPANQWENWGKEKKIIDWDKDFNPIGDNAAKLASHLGTCARNGRWFPLYWTSWDGMSKKNLEIVWKDVKANTNAPDGFKPICFKKLNKSWKSFKHELKKKYFLPFIDNPERLLIVPPEVQRDQWPELVSYWSMESTKTIAMRNMDNRGNLHAYPRIGRNSIPNIVDKRKKNNEPTDGISIWRATRAKKGKYTEDDGAAGIDQQFQRRLDELSEEDKEDPEKRERIFTEVIGSDGHGRVLCGGIGTRLGYTSSTTSNGTSPLSSEDMEAIEAELAKSKEESAELREEIAKLREETGKLREDAAERDRREEERVGEIVALKALIQVTQQSAIDAEARVIRMFHNSGFNTNLLFASNPSTRDSSGNGSNSRN